MSAKGILYGVGVGPGDPELLTVKAVRLIREADVIASVENSEQTSVAFDIAVQAVPEIKDKEAVFLYTPMVKDKEVVREAHRQELEKLTRILNQGRSIAFITLGDATIYSTFMYYQKHLQKLGYQVEVANGIPSFCSIAASLGVGLAENKESLVIHPATYQLHREADLPEGEMLKKTIVYMKAGKKLRRIKQQHANDRIWMIENCGLPGEKRYEGIDRLPDEAGYYTVVIVKEGKKE